MSEEKILKIAELLKSDKERAKDILNMSPEEATKTFTELGCDVTVDEIKELGVELTKLAEMMSTNGELDENCLDNVAGGGLKEFGNGVFIGVLATAVVAACVPW